MCVYVSASTVRQTSVCVCVYVWVSVCVTGRRATSGAGFVRSFRRLMALENVQIVCRMHVHLRRRFVFPPFSFTLSVRMKRARVFTSVSETRQQRYTIYIYMFCTVAMLHLPKSFFFFCSVIDSSDYIFFFVSLFSFLFVV